MSEKNVVDLSALTYFALRNILVETGTDQTRLFDEATLAKALRFISYNNDPSFLAIVLRYIADALDHPSAPISLRLVLPKRGGFQSMQKREQRKAREFEIARTVWLEFSRTRRMKPAIYAACKEHRVSYGTAYKALRREQNREKRLRQIVSDKQMIDMLEPAGTEEQQAYRQLRDWLYGFAGAQADVGG